MESVSLLRSFCFQEGERGQRERERDLRICSCIHSVHHPFIHSVSHSFIHKGLNNDKAPSAQIQECSGSCRR